ncbi:MAG TPA: DUF2306 domain-containing protein [Bryobacteraceae bacterium]|jgi:hypothetical protein
MRRALWICVAILSLIMITVATRRIIHLSPAAEGLDVGFARHRFLTLAHIVPGMAFVILGPFQFVAGLRMRHPVLHRWMGRVLMILALVIGTTALIMGPQMAVGGGLETAATFVFGTLFLFAFGKAWAAIRARRLAEHRRWMIRGYAIGLGVATVRPIVGAFFATSRFTHLTPHDFFGVAFWLGFIISLAMGEVWIRMTAGGSQVDRGK